MKKTYRSWYFNSFGQAAEWADQWDEESKTLSGKSVTGNGSRKGQFIDKDTIAWTVVAKSKDGKTFLDLQAKQTRRKAPVDKPKEEKTEGPPKPPELKVLERLIGTWDATAVFKVAEWTPNEVRTTSKVTRQWVLNGRFIQDSLRCQMAPRAFP